MLESVIFRLRLSLQGSSRSMASHNGTVGHHMPRVQEFTYPWNADNILVMHSDGLTSRWDLQTLSRYLEQAPERDRSNAASGFLPQAR